MKNSLHVKFPVFEMRRMDPPHVSLILENIFDKMDTPHLGNCRLVSKSWNYEASRILRRRERLVFYCLEDLQRYLQVCNGAKGDCPTLSFENVAFPSSFFYRKTKRCPDSERASDNNDDGAVWEAVDQFARVGGHLVKCLNVNFNVREKITAFHLEQLSKMVHDWFPNVRSLGLDLYAAIFDAEELGRTLRNRPLPNLRELSLWRSNVRTRKEAQRCQQVSSILFQTILGSAPNLQTMMLGLGQMDLSEMDLSSISPNLSSLSLIPTLSDGQLRMVANRNFPNLRSLHIYVDARSVRRSTMEGVLLQYKNSLQSLSLTFEVDSDSDHPPEFFPQFPPTEVVLSELEELTLCHHSGGMLLWGNLPKLIKLDLLNCSNIAHTLEQSSPPPYSQCPVKHLRLYEYPGEVGTFPGRILSFISLTSLSIGNMHLPASTQALIFDRCTQLRHLTLEKCQGLTNGSICGIPTAKIAFQFSEEKMEYFSEEKVRETMLKAKEALREAPYIGDLKELRTLHLDQASGLTDAAILYGIVNCSKLNRLELNISGLTWRAGHFIKHGLNDLVELIL